MATTTTDNNEDGDRDDDHMQRRSQKRMNSALPATHSSRLACHGLSTPTERNFQRQLATWRCAASLFADGAQHQPQKMPLHREQECEAIVVFPFCKGLMEIKKEGPKQNETVRG